MEEEENNRDSYKHYVIEAIAIMVGTIIGRMLYDIFM